MNSLGHMYFEGQEGMPSTSFQNELVTWLPENGVNEDNQNQIFGGSGHSCIPPLRVRRLSSGMVEALD
ncbi:hypothetical protein U1Q18_010766 [Sarracenia purpurea var. burkii]